MGLSGDTDALARWQRNINRLVGVPQRVASTVAPIFQSAITNGFASKTDPYGTGWKAISPKTLARGTQSILVRTGALMGSVGTIPMGTRLRILLGMPYAKYYITTGRGVLPQAGRIPDDWKVTIKRESERAFTEIAGGGA